MNFWKKSPPTPTVPSMTLPYNQVIKTQRRKYLLTFLLFFGFAVLYSYSLTQKKIQELKLVPAVVIQKNIIAPHQITASDITIRYFQQKNLPLGYWPKTEDLVGKFIIRDMTLNQILLPIDTTLQIDPSSISTQFTEHFAFSLDEDWLESRFPTIKKNDHIDILIAHPRNNLPSDFIATRVKVLSIKTNQKSGKKRLTLNVTPTEAQNLLEARAKRLTMQILVYSSLPKTP